MSRRTVAQRLFNPASPDVACEMTVHLNDEFIFYTQFNLVNYGDEVNMYDFAKCEPFILVRGEVPYKLTSLVSFVPPHQLQQHSFNGSIMFRKVDNLEYLEWKLEEKEKEEAALPSVS